MLETGKVPAHDVPRVIANARFAVERLPTEAAHPNLGRFAAEDFIAQHKLPPARALQTRLDTPPRVLLAILAKQKEPSLPLYLDCIEALDYPKASIVLYIRTNNNTDRTETILREWVARVGHLYAEVVFEAEDVAERVEQFGVHEWNATRFSVLGRIRDISLQRTRAHDCAFYFVCDVDNFIRPCTLRELVALDLPVVAPFLRSIGEANFYSNYHAEVDENGYYKECDQYHWVLNRNVRGVIEMPLVHCTYLIRADVCDKLTYQDDSSRFEYVVFSESARNNAIPQYIDNRQIYGYIFFDKGGVLHVEDGVETARRLLSLSHGGQNRFDVEWIVEGIFTGPSGIAQANRSLATALEGQFPGHVSIFHTDGALHGDPYAARDNVLALAERQPGHGYRVLIYQHWALQPPVSAADLRLAMVWWETTRPFPGDVAYFNRHYDALLAPSTFVHEVFARSNVAVPVFNVGFGHDFGKFRALVGKKRSALPAQYVFLHVSDCQPRKGVDILVRAFQAAFRRSDAVKLVIKGGNNSGGWQIADVVKRIKREDPDAPQIYYTDDILDDAALLALYDEADCVVLPTRGEGLGLPAAEALIAGKKLIVTGFGGPMDFVNEGNARLIKYVLTPATTYFATPGAMWAEPDERDLVRALREAVREPARAPCADEISLFFSKEKWASRVATAVLSFKSSLEGHNLTISETLSLLTPKKTLGYGKIRIGAESDGGYVMVNRFGTNTLCLSLGDGPAKCSWELAMAERGATVVLCHGTMGSAPFAHQNLRFCPIRVGVRDDPEHGEITLQSLVAAHRQNGQQPLVLKIDLEDHEWIVLQAMKDEFLTKFDQIVIEFHWLDRMRSMFWRQKFYSIFAKLNSSHIAIHVHGNNFAALVELEGYHFPEVLEVTYVRRELYHFVENVEAFPTDLDRPNCGELPDYPLGLFQFGSSDNNKQAKPGRKTNFDLNVHLVNLDRSHERLRLFRSQNPHIAAFERFSAVDGAMLNRAALVAEGLITENLCYENGTLGCALSHIALWKQCVARGRAITVFEDDILVSRNFEDIANQVLTSILPDWDFVQWGYIYEPSYLWVDLGFSKCKFEFYAQKNQDDFIGRQESLPFILPLAHSFGLQGYTVSPAGAQRLLDFCVPLHDRYIEFPGAGVVTDDSGIDTTMCGAYPSMKAFICVPPLIVQGSNIQSDRKDLNDAVGEGNRWAAE
jgi:GR25 family glycosyltransferase involved in LPS biosynthesis/glycosyltransferase involved in cell wall biosynthesis